MISVKTEAEIALMRQAGKILARIMTELKKTIQPGITTKEIDRIAEDLIEDSGATAAFKGYRGFPAATCISVNEEVIHGIPGTRVLREGDVVSLDMGIRLNDFYVDAAFTQPAGKIAGRFKKLVDVTRAALLKGITQAKAGNHLSDISCAVQRCVESEGFSVVREFVGHGIGRQLHEEPEVPNFGTPSTGPVLQPGMTLAIEPMVTMGTWQTEILDNGWTAVTKDKKYAAHFEHTVAITHHNAEVLTQ